MENQENSGYRSVGGLIPESLFWEFKAAKAKRHESGSQALENAIRLYLELDQEAERKSQNESEKSTLA